MTSSIKLYRASILHFPEKCDFPEHSLAYFQDGALIVKEEKILELGEYSEMCTKYAKSTQIDYRGKLIVPGLIDSHIHFPQTEMIAKYGDQLLEWLNNYTFPTEHKFKDKTYCNMIAKHFVEQLINNGTTTAFAYASVHKHSVDSLFETATEYNMAIITGKVCMDRNCPEFLQDTPESAQLESHELIEKWHQHKRNLYALTPRFAPTSTEKQLSLLGELAKQYPSVFIQTHLSENKGEVEWVKRLFPNKQSYLDVYDHYNMVHSRALFGHCLHLTEQEWQRLSQAKATAVFCPSSNLFLGSGLFSLAQAKKYKAPIALASDVGAGSSFNMFKNYGDAYKIGQLQNVKLSILQGLYMMTQGPASNYGLEHEIGNLNPNSFADFVVLNPHFDSLNSIRCQQLNNIDDATDMLFALSFIGDDRAIDACYIAGKEVKQLIKEQNHALS